MAKKATWTFKRLDTGETTVVNSNGKKHARAAAMANFGLTKTDQVEVVQLGKLGKSRSGRPGPGARMSRSRPRFSPPSYRFGEPAWRNY